MSKRPPKSDAIRPPTSGESPGNTLLSTGEVARLFGVSPSTVTRWAREGNLKAVRTPGGHFRFREAEIRRAALPPLDGLERLD
jgi:excisionase family DNA binding protein